MRHGAPTRTRPWTLVRVAVAAAAALVAFLVAAAAGPAEATAKPKPKPKASSFAVQSLDPAREPFLTDRARPGQVIRRRVRLVNVGDRAGTARLYVVDATTGATTGAVYRDRADPAARRGVGRWTRLSQRRVTLAPRATATIVAVVRVPRGVRTGQHLGGIVAENTAQRTAGQTRSRRGSLRVKIRNLTVLALQLEVPGKQLERLAIDSAKPGSVASNQTLVLGLRNYGNRLLKGRGRVTVSSMGRRVRSSAFGVDTFVPQTRAAFPAILRGRPMRPGRYQADVAIRYGRGSKQIVRYRTTFAVSRAQSEALVSRGQPQPPRGASGGPDTVWLVLGGLTLLFTGFGTSALFFRRRASIDAVL